MAEGERVTPRRQLLDVATPEQQRKARTSLVSRQLSSPLNTTGEGSAALVRAKAFLPALAAANEDLQQRVQQDAASVNIEEVSGRSQHIEMDISCGVFDLRDPAAEAAAAQALGWSTCPRPKKKVKRK